MNKWFAVRRAFDFLGAVLIVGVLVGCSYALSQFLSYLGGML